MAISATAAFSINTPIARGVVGSGADPRGLVAGRFGVGFLCLALAATLFGAGRARSGESPLDPRGVAILVISGSINGLAVLSFFEALRHIGASVQALVSVALIPTWTLLLLRLRGERMDRFHAMRLALGVVGALLIVGTDGDFRLAGIALVGIGALLYAAHLVSVQWLLDGYNVVASTTVIVGSAAVVTTGYWLATRTPASAVDSRMWAAIAAQGLLAVFAGRLLTYSAIRRIGSGQFSLLAPLETALVMVWSASFLGERLSVLQWVGTAVVFLSLVIAGRGREVPVDR